MPPNTIAFRSSFPALWRWTTLYCGIMGAALFVISWLSGNKLEPGSTIGISLLLGLLFAIAVVVFPVYVSPAGLHCYNFWGSYRTVAWHEQKAPLQANVMGLKYLRVGSKTGGSDLYLPLFLYDMQGFYTAVRQWAGPDHPLVTALESRRRW